MIAAGVHAASIQNKAGKFDAPEHPQHLKRGFDREEACRPTNTISITNPPKKATIAYPISTFTYAIIPHDAPQKGFLQQFAKYCLTIGQKYGAALDFAPLPKVVQQAGLNAVAGL